MTEAALEESLRTLAAKYPSLGMALVSAIRWLAQNDSTCAGDTAKFADRYEDLVTRTLDLESGQVRTLLEVHGEALVPQPRTGTLLCVGLSCYLQGAGALREKLQDDPNLLGSHAEVTYECQGYCHLGPIAVDETGDVYRVSLEGN